ncbi:anthranilate synthase component I [Aquisalinus flavus]|uniref:Anthranilate synthase component 1 n=1 Tax=Aquisalinus flavus TaxID=1526572 RepID=A0A8J2V2R8_9PROT|nr:anthranilate synthase component I [Aquisalinus flavus]MBD0427789.1 anthranilate synthase component I [Aquisalinus flavus]UNE47562.1 anthranilate synthase component I [Aquisalinus flavus]GGD03848.1 anthranilate synthase component I [Aquisalinus flavus]
MYAVTPEFSAFEGAYRDGKAQVLCRKAVSDLDTPVSAYLKLVGGRKNAFLLESVEGGDQLGRYSIIGLKPDLIWRAGGDTVEINDEAASDPSAFKPAKGPVLDSLRALLDASHIDLPEEMAAKLPPMFAGVFGFFGYDTIRQIERLPQPEDNGIGLPDAIFIRPTILAVFDNVKQEITFITPVRPQGGINARAAYSRASERLADVMEDLRRPVPTDSLHTDGYPAPDFVSNTTDERYTQMVDIAKEYINAGDIFQVVLSQRYAADFTAPPFELYRTLRRLNPSPFLFFLDFDECTLVGSSPEILVRVRDNEVTIRPIAGTRPRGATQDEDRALEAELLADPKECAEHLMLLDLGRNDVGRAAKIGSVQVTDQFTVERYSHVMHIVSNVTGQLSPDYDAVDALMAGFPAGTVSGAPKIRAMEIITELEKISRGPYAGCIGYFSANGNVDTCIALRTAVIKDGKMYVQAGAGIVADSMPEMEIRECRNKAGALIQAAKEACAPKGQ